MTNMITSFSKYYKNINHPILLLILHNFDNSLRVTYKPEIATPTAYYNEWYYIYVYTKLLKQAYLSEAEQS